MMALIWFIVIATFSIIVWRLYVSDTERKNKYERDNNHTLKNDD